jgi:hypothetical protein
MEIVSLFAMMQFRSGGAMLPWIIGRETAGVEPDSYLS